MIPDGNMYLQKGIKRARNSVILLLIIRNIYLVFVCCSWYIAPKILAVSCIRAIRASFVIIFGLLSSVPEIVLGHKGEMGVLLFIHNKPLLTTSEIMLMR